MYKNKVIAKRKVMGKTPIVFNMKTITHAMPSDALSDEAYSALVESLIDEKDDVESEFSMYKCAMIKAGTYYAKA